MPDELLAHALIARVLIGHKPAAAISVRNQNLAKDRTRNAGHMNRANFPATLDQRDDRLLLGQARAGTVIAN